MDKLRTTEYYLDRLFADNLFVELRHQLNGRWTTGWFDNKDSLLEEARNRHSAGNLFTSINRPHKRSVENKMVGNPIRNNDVKYLTRLFFDFDPIRPTDCASTEEELESARVTMQYLADSLSSIGWPAPLIACSGNGYHMQYRTALPNVETTTQMLKSLYSGLRQELNTELVSFDTTVQNSGRICTLYGTVKRKGSNTQERPHRQSSVEIPADWKQVSFKAVEALANYYARRQPTAEIITLRPRQEANINYGQGSYKTLDIVSLFKSHGCYKRPAEGNKHYVWCPWGHEHSTKGNEQSTATLIYEATDSWPGFYCHHAHCADRNIRDVIELWSDIDEFCAESWGVK